MAPQLEEREVRNTIKRLPRQLSAEQRRIIVEIATSGHQIDSIEALAGTGKTTSAGAVRQVYEEAGYRVLGAAPTARESAS